MNLYRINIVSHGGGLDTDIRVDGTASVCGDDVVFGYDLDGDGCTLTVKNGTVVQKRRGRQCTELTFSEGKTTTGKIGDSFFDGTFEVYTRKIEFKSGKGGYRLFLGYTANGENINLTFTALKTNLEIK